MADEFKIDFDKAVVEANGGWAGGTGDWIWAFGKSAVQSIPELVGITPGEDTLRWRANNPVSGFASELAGMAVPYGGWLRAARGIKALEGVAAGIEASKLEKPFASLAGAEAVRLAPFELGRTALSQVVGDKPLGEMATEAGINLALGAGVAGGLGAFGAMGRRVRPLRDVAPEVGEAASPQMLLRRIDEVPDATGELATHAARLDEIARGEMAGTGVRYVDPAISGAKDNLERLFRPGTDRSGIVTKQRPVTGSEADTFTKPEDWQGVFREVGVEPTTASRLMQYPRVITFNPSPEIEGSLLLRLSPIRSTAHLEDPGLTKTVKKAARVEEELKRYLEPVGDGWWMKREPDEGMYVMAKKFRGVEGTPAEQDAWMLFKTDKPGEFVKNSQQYNNVMVAREKWIVGSDRLERNLQPGELLSSLHDLQKKLPYENFADASAAGGKGSRFGKFLDKVAPEALAGNVATQHAHSFIREYFTPAARQFTKSARGAYTYAMGKAVQEGVDSFYQKLLQGELKFDKSRALFSKVVPVEQTNGVRSVQQVLEDLDKEKLILEFMRLVRDRIPAQGAARMAAEGKIQPRTVALAKELETIHRMQHTQLNKFEDAAGRSKTPFVEGSYGVPRTWDGDFFHTVREEGGKLAGLAAGGTQRAAKTKADDIATQLAKETGGKYRAAEAFGRNDTSGVAADAKAALKQPEHILQQSNLRGFKWDIETPDLKDLMGELKLTFDRNSRRMGTFGREALLPRHIAALSVEDPQAYKMLTTRFNQMAGIEGQFSKMQNKLVDTVLAPVLGANSATKLVQASNTALTHLTLGAGKLSHPISNIVGTIQTIAPEIAFVMNASADDIMKKYFVTAPAVGSRGTVGAISSLAPVKVMAQAVKATIKPDKDLQVAVNRALNDRVLDARIAEDILGQNRKDLRNFKGAIQGPREMIEYLGALSNWMPSASEKFARVVGFNAGYILGRDVLKITDKDVLYKFAKSLTEKTNYLYSSSDRPLAFTSPLGSSMGLFKNWQMNYMGSMLEYGNQAFHKGVWSPLIWQTLGTAATGGIAATPLYWAAEGASRMLAQKHLMQYAYDEWKDQADGIMFGLPAALTGVSLSSMMTAPGANPVKDATQLFSFAGWNRMKEAGGVVHAAMDNWQATGQHPASDPDVRNGLVKALAPVLLQRAMSVDEEGTVRNISTGLPSAKGLSWYDRLMYQAGLQPVMLERQMAATEALYQDREKMKAATKAFGDALGEAFKAGDNRAADIVLQRALAGGVDVSNVLKSAFTKGRQEDKTSAERLARPQILSGWENVLR